MRHTHLLSLEATHHWSLDWLVLKHQHTLSPLKILWRSCTPPCSALCLPTTCWPGCLSTALSKSASDLESGMSDNDSQLLVLPMLLLSMECKDNFNFNNNTLPPRGVAGRAFIVAISVHLCRAGNLLIMHKWSTGWGRAVQKAIKWRQQALLGADFLWVNTVQL